MAWMGYYFEVLLGRVLRWFAGLWHLARSDIDRRPDPEISRLAKLYPDAPMVWLEVAARASRPPGEAGIKPAPASPDTAKFEPDATQTLSPARSANKQRRIRFEMVAGESLGFEPSRSATRSARLQPFESHDLGRLERPRSGSPQSTAFATHESQAWRPSETQPEPTVGHAIVQPSFMDPARHRDRNVPGDALRLGVREFSNPPYPLSVQAGRDREGREEPTDLANASTRDRPPETQLGAAVGVTVPARAPQQREFPTDNFGDEEYPAGTSGYSGHAATAWTDAPDGDLWPALADSESGSAPERTSRRQRDLWPALPEAAAAPADSTEACRLEPDRFDRLARIQERP